jgi:heme exporter protein CcmD
MSEFLHQGGYAGFVWSAFGMTFGLLLIEILQLRSSARSTLTRIARLVRLRTPKRQSSAVSARVDGRPGAAPGAADAKP